jgi:hypothetical protein
VRATKGKASSMVTHVTFCSVDKLKAEEEGKCVNCRVSCYLVNQIMSGRRQKLEI